MVFSPDVGKTMRKWREIFEVKQKELSEYMGISPSIISDYETGRRQNPGIKFVRRYIEALLDIDAQRGGPVLKRIMDIDKTEYYEKYNFSMGITIKEFVDLIEGEVVVGTEEQLNQKIYGYTILDSLKVILEMPLEEFPLLYGGIVERALVFLGVSTGRSPLVVIRIAPIKPKVVVLMNLKKVDSLAIKIAEREKIPIVTTDISVSELKKRLNI
ncbi:MAG: helix-turn-helix domain-containing protein [Candidatus Micrarchaeota archaeon]|nr:helix-turn-helix domain-containing protein [Candidatus Micrarchaeota archaeon]